MAYPPEPRETASSVGKTICLNMIVKNEMANLERCLGSVADHIDCWVIGDTGSTDGTQDFIKSFFAARNLPGELQSIPFHNFEQARNAALDCAYASPLAYDYLLFDDADMELVVDDRGFRDKLDAPVYLLLQRTDSGLTYWNTRLVRRDAGARYRGVTHEYLGVPGGVKQLQGVWYKDHASGSNRVDKFQRDIRLLEEGLKSEPDNHRYWFYLAQSYRDAGEKAKAAELYAKRADMGGWDEEAWYARLQEARCLRDLGDEGGFLRQALAAFNQRPQRAEPLHDLARYFRERGKHDASVLFSEPGLAVQRPEPDILFLEDFVYSAGMQEEYSIAANYVRDPARKDRGFAACNWLALNRQVPSRSRELARWNLFYYLKPASALMPSLTARQVGFTPPDGYHPSNPSVARLGNEIVLLQRAVNFTLSEDGTYRTPNDAPIHTRNFLLRLDAELAIRSSSEILPPTDMPAPAFREVQGFEDARLFAWRNELWCIACVRELTPEGWCDQVLARIDDFSPGSCRLTDWRVLRPQGPRRHEKNWMPQIVGDQLQFIHLSDPTRVIDEHAQTIFEATPAIAAEQFRGGTQAILFDGGWLALVHEVSERDKRRYYQHRFVWFDSANQLRRVSLPFFFITKGVEFAAGLARAPDGKGLLISFGVGDGQAWIAIVEASDVRHLLEDIEQLPSGASESRGTTASTPKIKFPGVRSTPTAAAAAKPESRWTPRTEAAGTELMVAGLKERMGAELTRINLNVNYPGDDKTDDRPRVVWMHHDVNQSWVQWCKDKELVGSVDCFVFVSHWQKQRYLDTFELPPQRCVVMRHALDISPKTRCWEAAPILRCAYTSTPFRGLAVLLDAWERINPANAELHIWSSMKLYLEDDRPYEHLYARASSLRGVIYHGLSPNPELRVALRSMHFLTYPCTFAETACLAAIEAMAAGCRLIVPFLGALPETTAGFARVYPSNPNEEDHVAAFCENLAAELAIPWAGNPNLSLSQQAYCATAYDWPTRLLEWRQLIRRLCDQTGAAPALQVAGGA